MVVVEAVQVETQQDREVRVAVVPEELLIILVLRELMGSAAAVAVQGKAEAAGLDTLVVMVVMVL